MILSGSDLWCVAIFQFALHAHTASECKASAYPSQPLPCIRMHFNVMRSMTSNMDGPFSHFMRTYVFWICTSISVLVCKPTRMTLISVCSIYHSISSARSHWMRSIAATQIRAWWACERRPSCSYVVTMCHIVTVAASYIARHTTAHAETDRTMYTDSR